MPELPEVETTVRELNKKVRGRTFLDFWTDSPKTIKKPKRVEQFKKGIKGKKINKIRRRGKNIIIDLTGGLSLLVHQKLTGHLLYGNWQLKGKNWEPLSPGPLQDPRNRFLHIVFSLDNKMKLALSDLRKFAKVELWLTQELNKAREIKGLGPDPLEKSFNFEKLKDVLASKKGKIKQVLMDQTVIAGIGNIYSDEILWKAKIHPFKDVSRLSRTELKDVYQAIRKILKEAIELKGDSMSDYRLITGEKGGYQKVQKVYKQEGNPCFRKDGGIIKRVKIGGRSARFCPKCQILC